MALKRPINMPSEECAFKKYRSELKPNTLSNLQVDLLRYFIATWLDPASIYVCRFVIRPKTLFPSPIRAGNTICTAASRRGYLNVLIWARNCGIHPDVEASKAAASGGHIAVLDWLEPLVPFTDDTIRAAFDSREYEMVSWLYDRCISYNSAEATNLTDYAAIYGPNSIRRRIREEWNLKTTRTLIENGHWEVLEQMLRWILDKVIDWT